MDLVPFADVLAGAVSTDDSVTMELTPDWLQGRTAFGGWQAALAVLAMRRHVDAAIPLRTLQANFIAPVVPGPVTATAAVLRRGRSVVQVEARILGAGGPAFTAVGIFGAGRDSQISERPVAPAPARPVDVVNDLPYIEGVTPVFTQHVRQRWTAGQPPFTGAAHGDAQIHVNLRGAGIDSEAHLILLADAIPPPAIAMLNAPAMISSINWTLELVSPDAAIGRSQWLRFDAQVTAAHDGYGWQSAHLWSDAGELVALSRQCVAIFA